MSQIKRNLPTDIAPLWSGREDVEEGAGPHRWHEDIRALDPSDPNVPSVTLLGFAVDEGVRRNHGRPGAAEGPAAIRRALAGLPVLDERGQIADSGNISCATGDLEGAQQKLSDQVARLLRLGTFPLVLGGGHEVAIGTFGGLHAALDSEARILVINVDAHFDLRHSDVPTSGTSFLQMHHLAEAAARPLHCRMYGISAFANTEALFLRAHELRVRYVLDEALQTEQAVTEALRDLSAALDAADAVHLSICMDVLPAHVAPGVSAPGALGVPLHMVESLIDRVTASGKLRVAELAEVAPSLDIDGRTSRVAARLAARIARGVIRSR